jgi:drug/metabolite transporter (DMT)-like permease
VDIVLAACAALLEAIAVVLQRVALESAPTGSSLSPRLITYAVKQRGWLIGFGLLLGAYVVQAAALRVGQLSVVQPAVTVELVFLVAILVVVFHRRVGWREVLGVVAIVGGLVGFFASASPAVGKGQPDARAWVIVSTVTLICALGLVAAGRRGPRWWRAALLGAAASLLFAYGAALTKTTTTIERHRGWAHLFESWEPYVIVIMTVPGVFLLQSALHAGPIVASRTTNVIVNPMVSIVIGVTAFHERLRAGTGFVALDVLAIVVLCVGMVALVRSPLVAAMGAAPGDEYLGAGPPQAPVVQGAIGDADTGPVSLG